MSRAPLCIEISDRSAAVTRALAFLKNDTRLKITVRRVTEPHSLPEPGVLRVEPASLLYPALIVLSRDGSDRVRDTDVQAALTELAWEGGATGTTPWLESARALPRYARLGTPDPERPWVLRALPRDDRRGAPKELARLTGLDDPQPHELAAPSAAFAPGVVIWPPLRSTLGSLLGHVDAVVAPPGPLAWDAQRLGTPVFPPSPLDEAMARIELTKLANVVPPGLAEHAAFWRDLATDLLRGEPSEKTGTLDWVLAARALSGTNQAPRSRFSRLRRKARKFQRDPRAFLADSWLVKRVTTRG